MAGRELYETPDQRPLAEDLSPQGHLREYVYGEFEDDDLWDVDDHLTTCQSCGGNEERGYDDCEFGYDGSPYEPGPVGNEERPYGCPRMTGSF